MTTFDMAPSFRSVIAMKLASLAVKRERKANVSSNRVTTVLNAIIRLVLHLAGFGLLTMAGFQINIIAGYAVAGTSCFVMSTLISRSAPTETTEVRRAPDLRTGR